METLSNPFAALTAARQVPLAPLTGTERQVRWAEEIRRSALASLQSWHDASAAEWTDALAWRSANDNAEALARTTRRAETAARRLTASETALRAVTTARWWLDNGQTATSDLSLRGIRLAEGAGTHSQPGGL